MRWMRTPGKEGNGQVWQREEERGGHEVFQSRLLETGERGAGRCGR